MSACKEHYLMEAAHHLALLSALLQKLQNYSRVILLEFIHIHQNHSILNILTMLQNHMYWYFLMLLIKYL